jgi:hypothetical protein
LIDTGPDWVGLSIPTNKHLKLYSAVTLLSPMSSDFGHFVWDLTCRLIVIEKKFEQIHSKQIKNSQRKNRADFVINSGFSKLTTIFQVKKIINELTNGA